MKPRRLIPVWAVLLCALAAAACGTAIVAVGVPVVQYSATAWEGYELACEHFPRQRIDYRRGAVLPQDRTIARRINERLQTDPQLADCRIRAYSHLGHVWLVGRCTDYGQVDHATQTARATEGVNGITRLLYPPDVAGNDAERARAAARIRRDLNEQRTLRHLPVDVDVVAGKAVLMGLTPTEAQRVKIVDIARRAKGVTKVLSYLAIIPQGTEIGK